jgi:hypothetical protein
MSSMKRRARVKTESWNDESGESPTISVEKVESPTWMTRTPG